MNLNDHAKKDKAKWILTGITLILILALLGGVIAVLVVASRYRWFRRRHKRQRRSNRGDRYPKRGSV